MLTFTEMLIKLHDQLTARKKQVGRDYTHPDVGHSTELWSSVAKELFSRRKCNIYNVTVSVHIYFWFCLSSATQRYEDLKLNPFKFATAIHV
jgi:hypothetical protein